MIYLRYLRENTAKIRENTRKLASEPSARPTSGFSRPRDLPPAQESAPGNKALPPSHFALFSRK